MCLVQSGEIMRKPCSALAVWSRAGGFSQTLLRPACPINNVLDFLPTSLLLGYPATAWLWGLTEKRGEDPPHAHIPSPETLNFEREGMC